MADQDVIIQIGSSNMAGYLANLYDVPNADYFRWVSQDTPTTSTLTVTATASDDRIGAVGHGIPAGAALVITTTDTMPSPLVSGTTYYVRDVNPDWFKLETSVGSGAINITTDGTGTLTATLQTALASKSGRPYSASVPGVKLWTPIRPYSLNSQRTVTAVGGGDTTVEFDSSAITGPSPTVNMWQFIKSGTGRGNIRRITAVAGAGPWTHTISPTNVPAVAIGDTLVVLQDSHTISGISADNRTISKQAVATPSTPDFTSDVVGKFVLFFDVAAGTDITRKIVSQTLTTITLDYALTTLPGVGSGFCVLSGANSCADIGTINNAVLQNLTFTLDEVSPVFLTGTDYTNWDFSAFASPRGLSYDPSINSCAELSWQVRSKFGRELIVLQLGVSASMISPFTWVAAMPGGGIPTAASGFMGPIHDMTSLDYHPSSPFGIYPILVAAISSMRTLIEAAGDTMKVRGIFINLFDNDGADEQRTARIKSNTILLRDSLRTLLGDDTIPWIMSGPSAYAGGPSDHKNISIYRQLNEIAAEDPKSGVVDTRYGYTYCTEDSLHFTAYSQIRLGQDFFRVWEPIYDDLAGSPPTIDIAICNRALTVIGESPNITSISPAAGSAHAPLCELLFPDAVRIVADSRHWTFADRRVKLEKVRLASPTIVAIGSINVFQTATAHGFAIGSPVSFTTSAAGTGTVPAPLVADQVYYVAAIYGPNQFTVTATVGGYGTAVTLTSVGAGEWRAFKESDRDGSDFMYALPTDCRTERSVVPTGAPDDWPGMDGSLVGTPYAGVGVVATSRDGLNYSLDSGGFGSTRPIACRRALSRGGEQVIYTDLEDADLIYSRTLEDTTIWPPLFQEAVVFQLAAGLGGAIKRDVKIVDWCLGKAQAFISEAARVDGHRVVERDRQRYPWSR